MCLCKLWNVFDQTIVLLELAISELQNMLCAYISAIQCTCIVFTCDVCKYICGTIVYLSKANRFLFFWAGSCFASPGAGIPQGRGKVWKSERAGVSSNSRPFEWEGFDYLYYSQNMVGANCPPAPPPLCSDVPWHGKYNLRTEATK